MQTIVFDLDGTLVDSADDLRAAANRMLAETSLAPLDRETIIRFVGQGVETLVRRVLDHSGVDASGTEFEAHLGNFRRSYDANLTTHSRPYPGAVALLADCAARGFRLGVCTNKPEAPARRICDRLGLSACLGAVVGGDTLPARKPDARPLLHAVALLGGDPGSTLFVGDSETDYLTARAAGIRYVHFEGGYQRTPIRDFAPDFRIASLEEMRGILGSP